MSHTCTNFLMHCMDFRFHKDIKALMEQNGWMGDTDLVSLAGSAKAIVAPESQAVALRQIEISKTLHGMKVVHLMAHTDCGAYGGKAAFTDENAEYEKLTGDLKEARDVVKNKWPDLEVKLSLAHIDETDEHHPKITFEEIA